MAQPVMQFSFNSGEWAPALNARVDVAKYHNGAALLRNFFVDYRGGATARPGTKFIVATKDTNTARLISFQASFAVAYVLEFGNNYIRFISNGAQVLSGGVPYEIASPYTSSELAQVKFAQNVNVMVLCHPNHPPYKLTLNSATNWTLTPIIFGSTVTAPVGVSVVSTLGVGGVSYAYIVTAVDEGGQESPPSIYGTLTGVLDIRQTAGTNTISWGVISGAASYNVYRAEPSYAGLVPPGSVFGFIGNVTGLSMIDSNITPDFSSGPPVIANPFASSGVLTISITNRGTYTSVPAVTVGASTGVTAAAVATLQVTASAVVALGAGYVLGDPVYLPNGVVLQVTSVFGGLLVAATLSSPGTLAGGAVPANPVAAISSPHGFGASFNLTWGLGVVSITNPGSDYVTPPVVSIGGGGGGTAVAQIGAPSVGNPTVPGFFQQRLVLAGPVNSPQEFDMSQTGNYYNFNISNPIQADNAISGNLVSGQLNTIQSMVTQPQGLIILSDKQAWLVNGGSAGSPVSATQIVANSQAYNGASYQPPIVAGDNILYVQSKSSIVRDLVFNFYTSVYTGADISIFSSHLFYGFTILEWAWAEEPFKVVWAVRNDGALLSLTFLKSQELIAWAHSDTVGIFKSIAAVTETVALGSLDAVYTIVQRVVDGVTVQYIERLAELYFPNGLTDAWCVDAGIQYNGAATLSFSGAQHLGGLTVSGLATDNNGVVSTITPFVMDVGGAFILPAPTGGTGYTRVTIGIPYTCQLKTLQLDTGEPTIQGKEKKISAVTVRVNDTLGLEIGQTFDSLVPMKDLIRGNVGSATNEIVTDLVTGDAMTIIDPKWSVPGQYCIQQSNPFPASILGVIPQVTVGNTPK